MKQWKDVLPIIVLCILITDVFCFLVGFQKGRNVPPDPRLEAAHVLRGNAERTCKTHPEIIEEANRLLPDNDDGTITPADMRKVVTDVVERC